MICDLAGAFGALQTCHVSGNCLQAALVQPEGLVSQPCSSMHQGRVGLVEQSTPPRAADVVRDPVNKEEPGVRPTWCKIGDLRRTSEFCK